MRVPDADIVALVTAAKRLFARVVNISASIPDGEATWTEADANQLLELAEPFAKDVQQLAMEAQHGPIETLRLSHAKPSAVYPVQDDYQEYHERARDALQALTEIRIIPPREETIFE